MSKPSTMSYMAELAKYLPQELLQQVIKMQDDYEMSFRLREFEASVGDMVTITIDGMGHLKGVYIGEKYLNPQFQDLLSDTIPLAFDKAVDNMNKAYQDGVKQFYPVIREMVEKYESSGDFEEAQDDVFNIIKKKKDEDLH